MSERVRVEELGLKNGMDFSRREGVEGTVVRRIVSRGPKCR